MSKEIQSEYHFGNEDLNKDSKRGKFFSEPKSVFFTANGKPYCKLLIIGDFDVSDSSKKKELLATSTFEKLKVNGRKNNFVLLGEQNDEITLFISDFYYYEKHAAYPAYSGATMTVIIPNSDEDLRVCFNSAYHRPHKPAENSKVVYINLFEPKSDKYQAIESTAKELHFTDNQLLLEPRTFDRLVDIALNHTKEMFNRLTLSKKLSESNLTSLQTETATTYNTIL